MGGREEAEVSRGLFPLGRTMRTGRRVIEEAGKRTGGKARRLRKWEALKEDCETLTWATAGTRMLFTGRVCLVERHVLGVGGEG